MATKYKLKSTRKKIGGIKIWREVLLNDLNRYDSRYGPLRDYNIYNNTNALYSGKNNVTYLYTIDGYPNRLSIDFKGILRREVRAGVRISFISTFEKTKINWGSSQMKSKLRVWKSLDQEASKVDEFNYRDRINEMDSNNWRKESLVYLSDAEIRRHRELFKYRCMVVVSGERGDAFDETIVDMESTAAGLGLRMTRVESNLASYLQSFSPFSLDLNSDTLKEVGNNVIPDEIIARFSNYDQGKVGKKGMYWGTDIYSNFPCFKVVKKTSVDAENILITAETGGGKSFFVKVLLLQFLMNKNFTGTIMDIEGFEYTPLAAFVANNDNVQLINMAEGTGKYFDPVEIVMSGDPMLDRDMFSLSKSYTLSLFGTLCGGMNDEWTNIIINNAVAKTYSDAGVTADMSTWSRSKGLTLFDVYRNLYEVDELDKDYSNSHSNNKADKIRAEIARNTGYRDSLQKVIALVSRYFEDLEHGGTRSDVFKERVTLRDIKDAKLVVCSFGMAGKSPHTIDPIQMGLIQLYAAQISHIRSIFSQARGLYNFKLWEEFQRWGAFPGSEKIITTALTGGRKLGDVNLIITNKVSELLYQDKFGIFENITSFAVGAISDLKVRRDLCERLSVPLLKPQLDLLVTGMGNSETFNTDGDAHVSPFKNAFLIHLDKSISALVKMTLPPDLARSQIFRTGVLQQDSK